MRDFDDEPRDLMPWLRAGIRRVEAVEWLRWRFSLDEAHAWRAADVKQALTAAQWRTAAVTPTTVDAWRAEGIGPSEAVQWHEFKVVLEQAKAMRAKGEKPWGVVHRVHQPSPADKKRQATYARMVEAGAPGHILHTYMTMGWVDDEAIGWARLSIVATEAKLWGSLGLRPAEAAELAAEQQQPGDVVAQWWRAGIPFDEVADWIGAGLTADEAVAQRAAGVTVEQAAALRALRGL